MKQILLFCLGVVMVLHGEKVQVLSTSPRIVYVENFLTDAECNHLIERAKPQLKRSTVLSDQLVEGKVDALNDARTSQGMFLEKPTQDPILKRIEARISQLAGIPEANGEGMQILRYALGGEYRPHYDYFDPNTPGGSACYHRGGQRIATAIIYLATIEEGGETIFPYVGIGVKPVKGAITLFYNCTPDGKEDPLSLHGGAPVLSGEKWVAVKWLRQGVFR
ncbi:MAG: hypothetical protein RLZZ453_629 [Chlamydiota bacterium]|jgi:prolyl 4-hydroxylase